MQLGPAAAILAGQHGRGNVFATFTLEAVPSRYSRAERIRVQPAAQVWACGHCGGCLDADGGPLFNLRGEAIGVTHMKTGIVAEGMGYAVPENFVRDCPRCR